MRVQSITPGVIVGGVAAGATAGALIAMGHRLGSAGLPFAAIAAVVFRETASAGAVGLVFAGLVFHLIAMLVWGALFTWIVRRYRGREYVTAAILAALQFALSWFVARDTGSGLSTVLPLGDRLVFAVVFAGALVVGMRFALPAVQNA